MSQSTTSTSGDSSNTSASVGIDFSKMSSSTASIPRQHNWIPQPKEEIIIQDRDVMYFATTMGYFSVPKPQVTAMPHKPYPKDILFVLGTQTVNYMNAAKTYGSTLDGQIYVGDTCTGRNVPGTFSGNLTAKVAGIFPDDSVVLMYKGDELRFFRASRSDVSLTEKGWGRLSCEIM